MAGINFIMSSMVFNVVPTAVEVSLVAGILAWKCGPALAGLTAATLAAYVAFTFAVTQVPTPSLIPFSLLPRAGMAYIPGPPNPGRLCHSSLLPDTIMPLKQNINAQGCTMLLLAAPILKQTSVKAWSALMMSCSGMIPHLAAFCGKRVQLPALKDGVGAVEDAVQGHNEQGGCGRRQPGRRQLAELRDRAVLRKSGPRAASLRRLSGKCALVFAILRY